MYNKQGTPITRMWAHDGWCYIPELKVRQKFLTVNGSSEIEFLSESWVGIIPKPEHWESLSYLRESPLAWVECGYWGCDRFEQSSPSTKTSYPTLPPRKQPLQ